MSVETVGYVLVTWTNASKDAEWYSWRVYRAEPGTNNYVLLSETLIDAPTYEYHDWEFGSMVSYDYVVAQVANRFGSLVESAYDPVTVTPTSTDYWIIDRDAEANNLRLGHVTADSFTTEREKSELQLIGRGRHIDYGETWGKKGALTGEFRDDSFGTGREHRLALEALQELKQDFFLRNPFGDLWQVAFDDAPMARLAGIGQREYNSYNIPYSQVAD